MISNRAPLPGIPFSVIVVAGKKKALPDKEQSKVDVFTDAPVKKMGFIFGRDPDTIVFTDQNKPIRFLLAGEPDACCRLSMDYCIFNEVREDFFNGRIGIQFESMECCLNRYARFRADERNGKVFPLDDLLVINELYYDRRIDAPSAGKIIQKGTAEGRRVLEHLHELGLVEERGERSGRVYHLPALLYKRFRMKAEYMRAKGFEPLQQEQMVIEYVKEHGRIRWALCCGTLQDQ
ncbi:MAG: hypothetical protein NTZ39_06820 [Methanoregula sp.]|nr:hypothetical protein [Methanoregula sp.]